ncbi:MAG: glycosyltransferase family 2 protein [Bacteroidetes bacterium]|nr:glycosyltransferase family 2 protein [Bacteroidota bacterium]
MIAVIIPSFRVRDHILGVLAGIGPEVGKIYVVDDACPQGTGNFVKENCSDDRVEVIINPKNLGVGGAVMAGYKKALEDGCTIMVKLDGDGQMAPSLIPKLVEPIAKQEADYVKGNRFYDLRYLRKMPGIRRFGNSMVSFISKMACGYWNIMDPANGFTAISATALKYLPLDRIDNRFFFENDMLFRLYTIRAVVRDMPLQAVYGNETSNISISKIAFQFPFKYLNRLFKRIFYTYFLRDFNIGSLELVMAFIFLLFGFIFGGIHWLRSVETHQPATAGTVLLAGLPIILGFQSLLAFLHYDVANIPQKVITED